MAYDSATVYATRDKYMDFAGIDLNEEFKNSNTDNPTRAVALFIKNLTTWTYTHLNAHYDLESDLWDDDTFTQALMWQIKHTLTNGEDGKLDKTAYSIMHSYGMIVPAGAGRYTGAWR